MIREGDDGEGEGEESDGDTEERGDMVTLYDDDGALERLLRLSSGLVFDERGPFKRESCLLEVGVREGEEEEDDDDDEFFIMVFDVFPPVRLFILDTCAVFSSGHTT